MSLLNADNPGRLYFEQPIWIGQVERGEWASFIISTPVMFYAAGVSWNRILSYAHWILTVVQDFHRRSLQELWFLWRPGSRASWAARFLRFGSMNLLVSFLLILTSRNIHVPKVSLGVSVAYFSSVAELAISASRDPNDSTTVTAQSTYFDSVVFLTMFLLIGT